MTKRNLVDSRGHRSALFFLAFVAVAATAAVAGARTLHLRLARAEPAAESTVTVSPKELKLYFSENVKAALTSVRLTAPDSSRVELGPLVAGVPSGAAGAEGKIAPLIAPVKGAMKNGKHKVEWRTVGADGHALTGIYSFTLKAAAPPREPDLPK